MAHQACDATTSPGSPELGVRPGPIGRVAPASRSTAQTHLAALAAMVDAAATTDLADDGATAALRARAHRVTTELARAGHLPAHLRVERNDPTWLVLRTLAAAARAVGNRC